MSTAAAAIVVVDIALLIELILNWWLTGAAGSLATGERAAFTSGVVRISSAGTWCRWREW